MGVLKTLRDLTTPVAVLDDENLREFCAAQTNVIPIADLAPRELGTVVGEVTSVRLVPQSNGSPWLEATISDGTSALVAMWTGRKRIAGVRPGARIVLTGRGAQQRSGTRLVITNPRYELL